MKRMAIIGLLVLVGTGLGWTQQAVEERRPASPDGNVEIENIAGSVVVIGWDRDELEVTGILGKGTKELDISGDRDSWTIEVDLADHRDVDGSDLTIRLPRGSRIVVETVSADIEVSEVRGEVNLDSVSGEVHLKGNPREADIETVSGTIRLETRDPLQGGDFETVSGDIFLDAELSPKGRFDFESVSGSIELRLPRNTSADFDVETFSGDIDNDFGVEPERTSRYLPSQELSFSIGGGGARVSVTTLSGSIELLQR